MVLVTRGDGVQGDDVTSVCSRLADWLGMKKKNVRIFFIYSSFFSLGFWFFLYLILAFWLRIKDLISSKRSSVFDL